MIFGISQLLAERGDQFDRDRRTEMRAVVLRNATTLKDIVEDLSVFLDERVSELVGHTAGRLDPPPTARRHRQM